ncbi:MAG: sugar ABC transporter substrate-binding protein [Chloroflexota bacterium]
MKIKLTFLAFCLLTAGLSACSGPISLPAPPIEIETPVPELQQDEVQEAEVSEPDTVSETVVEETVEIRYIVWDVNQFPAYEACAAKFSELYPNIQVNVEQIGWGDYWSSLNNELAAGNAPDVFTNHLSKYPEFLSQGYILDIQPFVDAEELDVGIYLGELERLWVRDGGRYGLPKDWDTVAVVYDSSILEAVDLTIEDLNEATWNLEDGGSFTEIVKKLTLDENGNDGLSPDFDKTKVARYGYAADYNGTGAYGQTVFSMFAASTGWNFVEGLYATEYYYDDPRFIGTMQWFQDMIDDGYFAPYEEVVSFSSSTLFADEKAALTTDGSWMIGFYSGIDEREVGFARLPIGPNGRKSMFNGLADSIWTGTEHPEAAWEWVKYAASPPCAQLVGNYGVVFPAIQSGVWNAIDVYTSRGVDVSAFTSQVEEGGTFLFPITDNASAIDAIMTEAFAQIYQSEDSAERILVDANTRVNAIFE